MGRFCNSGGEGWTAAHFPQESLKALFFFCKRYYNNSEVHNKTGEAKLLPLTAFGKTEVR